jgi:hypothetical protein
MAKEIKENKEFINPFEKGVDYKMFLEAAGKDIEGYCKGKLTEEQIDWLKEDLKYYKK